MMTTYASYHVASPRDEEHLFHQVLQIIGGSLFIALCSQIRIPLPFSIVPLTLQTLAVMLLGGVFGSRKSALMVLAHFTQILMAWPVLAGGNINPLAFIGPRGGYILGFLVQAYLVGWLIERSSRSVKEIFLAGLFACTVQMGLGVVWLSQFVGISLALSMGLYPFIVGEILKVFFVCLYLKRCQTH